MLSPLRNRFGIPGVIAVIALVFAMVGGAYAANNSSGGKATASAKGKPGPRGKTGKTGPAGPQGPAGPKGDTGPAGPKGDTGSAGGAGAPGNAGAPGKSVVLTPEPEGANCEKGGTKVEVEGNTVSKKYVCNGKNGTNGTDGQTGFTETLPSGKTETGVFRSPTSAGTSIEFNIPLPAEIDAAHQKIVSKEALENEEVPTECENSTHAGATSLANPEAAAGYLCVFTATETHPVAAVKLTTDVFNEEPVAGAGTTGAYILGSGETNGTWAVTAP